HHGRILRRAGLESRARRGIFAGVQKGAGRRSLGVDRSANGLRICDALGNVVRASGEKIGGGLAIIAKIQFIISTQWRISTTLSQARQASCDPAFALSSPSLFFPGDG